MRQSTRIRRRLLLLLALLIGADTLVWVLAENWLAAGFAHYTAANAALGWTVAAGTPASGGWPFAATLTLPGLSVSGGPIDRPDALAWRADRAVLRISPLHPATLTIAVQGGQHLRFGRLAELGFIAARFQASVALSPGAPSREVRLDADDLRLDPPAFGTVAKLRLSFTTDPAATRDGATLAWQATASDIGLPPPPWGGPQGGGHWALGDHVAALAVAGRLSGPVPLLPGLYARARAWRDGGGTLQLQSLSLSWGALDLSASATLALDAQMQPAGTASAQIVNPAETLDALAAGGAITRRGAGAAKAMLMLMMAPPQNGAAPRVKVPLTLRERRLSIGGIPLADMPEMFWPGGP
jgi:hypothetical protein